MNLRPLSRLILFTALVICSFSSTFAHAKIEDGCQESTAELKLRKEKLTEMLHSVEALVTSGQSGALPLDQLFQLDLTNSQQVQLRATELEGLTQIEKISALPEFAKYAPCSQAAVKELIKDLEQTQALVNAKKVEFLKLKDLERISLARTYSEKRNKSKDSEGLQAELDRSEKNLDLAKTALQESQTQSAEDSNDNLIVDQFRVAIESEHIEFLEQLKSRKEGLEQLQSDLSRIAKSFGEKSRDEISHNYELVTGVWETAVERLLELFDQVKIQSSIEPPASRSKDSEDALARHKALDKERTKMLNDLKVQNFNVLQQAGTLRARLLHICDRLDCERPRGLNAKNIQLIFREIRVVPLRFWAGGISKFIEIRGKFSAGLDGWISLLKQAFLLFILLLIPFALIRFLKWSTFRLEAIQRSLLARSSLDYQSRTKTAVWIARLNPFVPSVGMILSIAVARFLISGTDFRELAEILYYFQVYYVYRMTRLLLRIGLEVVFATDSIENLRQQKTRIQKSATRISRIVFIEYALLHLTEDTVRQALAYQFFSTVIFWLNLGLVIFEAAQWQKEITNSFSYRFQKIWKWIQPFYQSKAGKALLPFMFAAVVGNDVARLIGGYLARLDIVKRLLSDLLRKRLEGAEAEVRPVGKVPQDYLQFFDYYLPAEDAIFIEREDSVVQNSSTQILEWSKGATTDDLLLLVGNRGMGKTTALAQLVGEIQSQVKTKLSKFPARILDRQTLFALISELAETPIASLEEFRKYEAALTEKVVFCLDDLQNLFLAINGGFEAYRAFIQIISLATTRIYWCLTVNSRSWAYLQGVMGPEHFYGQTMILRPWTDLEIQKLILIRHSQTQYSRTFDNSIKAYGVGDNLGSQAEGQFFRLLWGQSRGNPRSALMYWVTAISTPAENRIYVGIPSFVSSSQVSSLSDDALFLLSAITKHESLNHEELRELTSIGDSVIRKCLKEARDKQLIWFDEQGRARISSRAQYVIDYFLTGKNFLYEWN